jgi:hypothetical protein
LLPYFFKDFILLDFILTLLPSLGKLERQNFNFSSSGVDKHNKFSQSNQPVWFLRPTQDSTAKGLKSNLNAVRLKYSGKFPGAGGKRRRTGWGFGENFPGTGKFVCAIVMLASRTNDDGDGSTQKVLWNEVE